MHDLLFINFIRYILDAHSLFTHPKLDITCKVLQHEGVAMCSGPEPLGLLSVHI